MNATTRSESNERPVRRTSSHTWGWYILVGYSIVFLLGIMGIGLVVITSNEPSLWTSGLTVGFIFFGLSALALLTYPAYHTDVSTIQTHGEERWFPSTRQYLTIGVGIPIVLGILLEVVGLGFGTGLTVPGFITVFVVIVLHPIVVFVTTLVYLYRRRRHSR